MSETARAAELRENLARVHERIHAACVAAGREPASVSLTVVTKFFPAADVRLLADLGVVDVGENRHQEAEPKAADCAEVGVRWHFIGALQSNKAAAVARYADVVESVDRAKLIVPLSRGAQERGRALDVLVQVSLDPPDASGRSGAPVDQVADLAARIAAAEGLRLRGVMAVAPLGLPPQPAFERLAQIAGDLRREHPEASWISAGMSGDLEVAIASGATHVRIGSAVLGQRPHNR